MRMGSWKCSTKKPVRVTAKMGSDAILVIKPIMIKSGIIKLAPVANTWLKTSGSPSGLGTTSAEEIPTPIFFYPWAAISSAETAILKKSNAKLFKLLPASLRIKVINSFFIMLIFYFDSLRKKLRNSTPVKSARMEVQILQPCRFHKQPCRPIVSNII